MNETMKTLLNRRSVREYRPEQIKDEELNAVLEAGKFAPTGSGKQSPIFIAVQNREVIQKLAKLNAEVMGVDFNPYYDAPTIILVLVDRNRSTAVEDGSLALGNMFNAAASLGLGSCWIHRCKEIFEKEEGKELLRQWGVKEDQYIGVGSCILGYPKGELPQADPRKEDYVRFVK